MRLGELLRRLWPHLRPYRWIALGTTAALALQGFLEAYPAILLLAATEQITGAEGDGPYRLLLYVGLWYGCAIASAGMALGASYAAARLGTGLGADLRQELHDHIQKLSSDFFEERQTGDLLNRSMGDVTELQHYLVSPITWVGNALFSFGFAFYFLMRINWQITLYCMPVGLLLIIAMYRIAMWIRPVFRRYREVASNIYSQFSENVSGIREIQAFTREADQSARYSGTNLELRQLEVRTAVISQLLTTAFMLIFPLATVIVLWQGGVRVQAGTMGMPELLVFLYYARMLVQPLRGMGGHYAGLQRALVSAERVIEVLDTAPLVQEAPDAIELPPGEGGVEFEGVSFTYDGKKRALEGVSFTIEPGQIVALVGPSGAGKTTLIKLLLRYYDPQEGRILLDGTDLRKVSLGSLRGQLGVVFQDPFLFNGSLLDNIAFGRPEASREEIVAAAQAADLASFVEGLEEGYDTVVGERGVKLSGGQRSRLAIARAMLRDPRILILDEATAAVDTESERRIQAALDRLMSGRTCVVIAHRLSTVTRADQILVLNEGRLVESGGHGELMARAGFFAQLYRAQFKQPA